MRAGEMAGEKPVGGPLAEPRQRRQRGGDLLVGEERRARRGRARSARAPSTYAALLREKPSPSKSARSADADPLARRELPRDVVPDAEARDEAGADRGRGAQRDLLRRDRDDERLERLAGSASAGSRRARRRPGRGRDRAAAHSRNGSSSNGSPSRRPIPPRPRRRRARRERRPAPPRPAPPARRRRGGAPPSCQTVATSVPNSRKPRRRELEVVRLLGARAGSRRERARRRGSRRTARGHALRVEVRASPSRAKTREAASATQRSEKPSPT